MGATRTFAGESPETLPRAEGARIVASGVWRGFFLDECIDIAAGLTFRTVLSFFPALLTLGSLLSLWGQNLAVVDPILAEARTTLPPQVWAFLGPTIDVLLTAPSPGIGLVVGLVSALWVASGYVKAFGRAMNRIYGVLEGRHPVKFNIQMYLLTAVILLGAALGLIILLASGPVAATVGHWIGLEETTIRAWETFKWLGLAFLVTLVIGLLYHATPNVRQPRRRVLSVGATFGIVVSLAGSLLFFALVSRFGSFNVMYGALAGAIIALWWIYLVNAILLVGGQIDAQRLRVRQLRGGLDPEDDHWVDLRDTRQIQQRLKDDEKARTRDERYREAYASPRSHEASPPDAAEASAADD